MSQKPNTRTLLLEASQELFSSRGYSAVSTRQIADKAGVNLGAIQYYFGSKSGLFIETVHHLISTNCEGLSSLGLGTPALSRIEAAGNICSFIFLFTKEMCNPQGHDLNRIMHREILTTTPDNMELIEALLSLVVDEFWAPIDRELCALVRILLPEAEPDDIYHTAHSIAGQCVHLAVKRPYIARLRGRDFGKEPLLSASCESIARFSLRAVGLSEREIDEALFASNKQT